MSEESVIKLEQELAWKEREIDKLTTRIVELTKALNLLLKPNKERICE